MTVSRATIGFWPDHLTSSSPYGVPELVAHAKSRVPTALPRLAMRLNSSASSRDSASNGVELPFHNLSRSSAEMALSPVAIEQERLSLPSCCFELTSL